MKGKDRTTQELINFVRETRYESLPPQVISTAKKCFLDTLGCAIGGYQSCEGSIVTEFVRNAIGSPQSVVLGEGFKCFYPYAAFANATMANSLDFDDTLFGHHGATVIPTVLSIGEIMGSDGKQIIEAIVIGYETSIRTVACLKPKLGRFSGMWDLGTLQITGVVAAVGKLLGLNNRQLENAFGLAFNTSPVPTVRKERKIAGGRSMLKSGFGYTVQAGIHASILAQQGFTGPSNFLDGDLGFWIEDESEKIGITGVADSLGENYGLLQVEFKPYPACRFLHPALEATEKLLQEHEIRPQDIVKVEVETFALLADEYHNIGEPTSITDAQFSLPFCIGLLIHETNLTPSSFQKVNQDRSVLEVVRKVAVKVDDRSERKFPDQLTAEVTIFTQSGEQRSRYVETPKGDLKNPMTEDELSGKFFNLTEDIYDKDQVKRIVEDIDRIEEEDNFTTFAKNLENLKRR
ncbi:MAG: MmgE/PrpD family protein [Candidatus Bipolaricaulia bacterium]